MPKLAELIDLAAWNEIVLHEDPWVGLQLELWPDARHQEPVSEQLQTPSVRSPSPGVGSRVRTLVRGERATEILRV